MTRPPPRSPLFPPTTLFRSRIDGQRRLVGGVAQDVLALAVDADLHAGDRKSTRLNSSHGYTSDSLFFFNDPAPPEISPLPPHDALPISDRRPATARWRRRPGCPGLGRRR